MRNRITPHSRRWAIVVAAAVLCASVVAAPSPASAVEAIGERIPGENRYDTATLVSSALDVFDICEVVVANGESFPDGLAGSVFGVPILLTRADALPNETAAELDRLATKCEKLDAIYVLGGTAAVSEEVFDELGDLSDNVRRLGGSDRYETALAIADAFGVGDVVLLATGRDFPDALAAGPLAGLAGWPIILNDGDALRPDVRAFLQARAPEGVWVLGGSAAVPDGVVEEIWSLGINADRLAGANRFETAAEITDLTLVGEPPFCTTIVNGEAFADALAAGPWGAWVFCPITLVNQDNVPAATNNWLATNSASLEFVVAMGGTAVISAETLAEAAATASS